MGKENVLGRRSLAFHVLPVIIRVAPLLQFNPQKLGSLHHLRKYDQIFIIFAFFQLSLHSLPPPPLQKLKINKKVIREVDKKAPRRILGTKFTKLCEVYTMFSRFLAYFLEFERYENL